MSGRNDYPHVLTCQLSPQTDPATTVISWRVSDRYLPRGVVEQGNRLVFPVDIDKAEHEGTYICLAENEMGRDQLEAVVYVEGLPKMADSKRSFAISNCYLLQREIHLTRLLKTDQLKLWFSQKLWTLFTETKLDFLAISPTIPQVCKGDFII